MKNSGKFSEADFLSSVFFLTEENRKVMEEKNSLPDPYTEVCRPTAGHVGSWLEQTGLAAGLIKPHRPQLHRSPLFPLPCYLAVPDSL